MGKKNDRVVCSIPVGTRVKFTLDRLGACPNKEDLFHTTEEIYGAGDVGIVSFPHPNRVALPDWFYVEVDSKEKPGEKRYVGVSEHMVERMS